MTFNLYWQPQQVRLKEESIEEKIDQKRDREEEDVPTLEFDFQNEKKQKKEEGGTK